MLNDKELKHKVNAACFELMKTTGIITPVEVLMNTDILCKTDYENWRHGKVDYLERVCKINLRKLSELMREMRTFANKNDLKPSWTYYHGWAKNKNAKLRFSKSGNEDIERSYATHYISHKTLNASKTTKQAESVEQ